MDAPGRPHSQPVTRCPRIVVVGLLLTMVVFDACSGRRAQLAERLDSTDAELRTDQEALRKELASQHLRQQLLAERLRQAEEELVRLRAQMLVAGERPEGLGRRSSGASTPSQAATGGSAAASKATTTVDPAALYEKARAHFGERQYGPALELFAQIVTDAPKSAQADNAQYWIGECHYGEGRFRRALHAFGQVLAYKKTEKDDDAQLKIARCHLALGEKDQAIAAFQGLLQTFPNSEYVGAARRELRYLEGP